MADHDWSREEVEATVGDYFAMLRDELAGLSINKSERNLRLRSWLQNRSKGSVEFKHANIRNEEGTAETAKTAETITTKSTNLHETHETGSNLYDDQRRARSTRRNLW